MSHISLLDGRDSFEASVLEASTPARVVLFAVGGGGDPERHLPLLSSLANQGCTVVAPHFSRLASPIPTADELRLRARRLGLALDAAACHGLPVAGVGHSIGATMLLALAGGHVWLKNGQRLGIAADPRLDRLALLAPATDFFRGPGALDAVHLPILAWAGQRDAITPPSQVEFLKDALAGRAPVEIRVIEDAGHFSFMDVLPPQAAESLPDRAAFLAQLAAAIRAFVAG